ncbi:hypothetical protein [Allorhizocola rhizosphaerae]|uniref:hypothetical protein n=1 Tax=Allorhizocola rhizosphaerae TaxID=1872709 RepID=UPI000E3C9D58|nr:hypothetical protein [Allorhizocola rhizosphaerae]
MRQRLLSTVAAALIAAAVAVPGAASPAHAGFTVGPPPGYLPPPHAQTTPPDGCHVYYFTHKFPEGERPTGSMTECTRMGGLHRAAAQCSDGRIIHGWTEEMEYFRQSLAMCRAGGEFGSYVPALYVWGEYWTDW